MRNVQKSEQNGKTTPCHRALRSAKDLSSHGSPERLALARELHAVAGGLEVRFVFSEKESRPGTKPGATSAKN